MGFLFGRSRSRKSSAYSSSSSTGSSYYEGHLKLAKAFAGLCYKIGKGGERGYVSFSVDYKLRVGSSGCIEVYATHVVHDDFLLNFAYEKAMENDRAGVEYAYNRMIEEYKLTSTELLTFPDVTDFMDCLRGGIRFGNTTWSSCKQVCSNDIEITQELGKVQPNDKNLILMWIKHAVQSSYSHATVKEYNSCLRIDL